MSPFEEMRSKARHAAEIVHLRSNHHLKGDLTAMDNDELIRYQRSTRRAISGSIAGAVITTAISHSFPLFVPSAGIKIIQTINTAKDRHRVKKEIEARSRRDKDFDDKLRQRDKPIHDVIIGTAITTGTIGLTYGIIGGDNALDAVSHVAHHVGGEHVGNAVAGHAISQDHASYAHQLNGVHQGSSSGAAATADHPHPRSDLFTADHPHLAHADGTIHKMVNGVGDAINQNLSHTTHISIQEDTTWDALRGELHTSSDIGAAAAQIGIAGLANEATTPLLVAEPAVDRIVERQSERKRLRLEGLAAGHVDAQNAASGYGMSLAEREKQSRLLSDNAAEMRKMLARRQLAFG